MPAVPINSDIHVPSSALIIACQSRWAFRKHNRFHDTFRLLAQDFVFHDLFEGEAEKQWIWFRGDADTFSWILQTASPTYEQRSLEARVLLALEVCRAYLQYDMTYLMRTILKGVKIDEQVCSIKDIRNYTLLHSVAKNQIF